MIDTVCAVDGCEKPIDTRGWCRMHYIRWNRHGDPLTTLRMRGTPQERFWAKVEVTGFCWLWTGTVNPGGYGVFDTRNEISPLAHRVAYTWLVAEIPEGLVLDHLCRIRRCVNPDHLEPITLLENILRGYGASANHKRATHCKHGHAFDEANTRILSSGIRQCIACAEIRQAKRGKKKRAVRCKYGHCFDEANTRVLPSGVRQCITCAEMGRAGRKKLREQLDD